MSMSFTNLWIQRYRIERKNYTMFTYQNNSSGLQGSQMGKTADAFFVQHDK